VSGGAGAVGTTVAKAILESGGDVVLVDIVDFPGPQCWGKLFETCINPYALGVYLTTLPTLPTLPTPRAEIMLSNNQKSFRSSQHSRFVS
jgi:hypothetical protein